MCLAVRALVLLVIGCASAWSIVPVWSHPHARSVEDAFFVGDFRTRVGAIADHLKTEESEEAQCELGSQLGQIAWDNRDKLELLSDEVIRRVASLISGPTREGKLKCLTAWAANFLQCVGPRAAFAVPALERALAEAEAAEAKRERGPLYGWMNHQPLDQTIRAALEAIRGKAPAPADE
jgi:hypothetical protein